MVEVGNKVKKIKNKKGNEKGIEYTHICPTTATASYRSQLFINSVLPLISLYFSC